MKTETAQIKFGEWLLNWGVPSWDIEVSKHWETRHIKYTDRYTTNEMFNFFKLGKKWTDA